MSYTIDDFLDSRTEKSKKKKNKKQKKSKKTQFTDNVEALLYLANKHKLKKSKGFKLKKYQKMTFYIYDKALLDKIMEEFDFIDIGNIYDYDKYFKRDNMESYGVVDYSLCNRIAISRKNNSLLLYSKMYYAIGCTFLINIKKIKEFLDISSAALSSGNSKASLKNENFDCGTGYYLELSSADYDSNKQYEISKKKIADENLVFEKDSTLSKIRKNVLDFFTEKTEEMYKKLDLPFKRGIILYGEPGNGKSCMIREIIRTAEDDIVKVVIKNVNNLADTMDALIVGLDGRKSIIIIEDIDSMLNPENRSDFLNAIDGLDVKSGLYIIATTNYPEKLDSAIFNRPGRFDKAYEIGNPDDEARKEFFKSRDIYNLLKDFNYSKKYTKVSEKQLLKKLVDESKGVSMALLKEIITSVLYSLVSFDCKYIKEAIEKTCNELIDSRNNHDEQHNAYLQQMNQSRYGYVPEISNPVKIKKVDLDSKENTEKKKHVVKIIKKKK